MVEHDYTTLLSHRSLTDIEIKMNRERFTAIFAPSELFKNVPGTCMGKFSHFKKIHILKLLQNNEIKNSKNSNVISILITSKATKTLKTFFNSRIQKLENKLLQVF